MSETEVIYNAECPVCRFEIDHYRDYATARALPLQFSHIGADGLLEHGITEDMAARRLHVIKDGTVLSGVPAFAVLWAEMPRYRWLSKIVMWPIIRPLASFAYDKIAAPILYRSHLKRRARAAQV
ncbi:MAG: DUF393 domain-containing protein [Pseudomonadota bacterium]